MNQSYFEVKKNAKECIQLLISQGQLNEALTVIDEFLKIEKNDSDMLSFKGIIAIINEDFSGGLNYLLKAREFEPENTDILYNLGFVLEKIGEFEGAYQCYQGILELSQDISMSREIKEKIDELAKEGKIDEECSEKIMLDQNPVDIKKILFIQSTPDIRTNKVAQVVCQKGIEVDILYLGMHPQEVYANYKLPYKKIMSIDSLKNGVNFVNESNYDLIYSCNEPDYLTALFSNTNKPIIHDCHDMMSLRGNISTEQLVHEYIANSNCDGNVYVTRFVKSIAEQIFDIHQKPTLILDNYVLKNQIPKKKHNKLSNTDNAIHCVYEGGITNIENHHRCIEPIFMMLANRQVHVHYYSVFEHEYYHTLSNQSEFLHYEGVKEPNELIEEMTKYDIGLTVLNVNDRNKTFLDTTFPNKAWEYLAAGLPILFSDLNSFHAFLKQHSVGEIINMNEDLRVQIERIKNINVSENYLIEKCLTMDDYADEIINFFKLAIIQNRKGEVSRRKNEI